MTAGSSLHVGGEEGHSSRPETVILAGTALEFSYSALDPGGELSISTLGGREKLMKHRPFPGPCRLAVVTGSHRWASLLRLLVNPTSYFFLTKNARLSSLPERLSRPGSLCPFGVPG